jgi:peptidoglycan/xylan/chitin deacetylase (PgdA/CDA1 family)
MSDALYCFTVDDVGIEGYTTPEHLDNVLELCDEEGIKATFFVVPRPLGKEFPRGAYAKPLAAVLAAGHAIGQHGLEHGRFDLGIPPKMVLDLPHEGPAREYLASHRHEIEQALGIDKIRGQLREGRKILEDMTGSRVEGFRAPCLSVCDNLFTALDAEGYRYDSSKFFQKAAWDLINGENDPPVCPITREAFDAHQFPGRTRQFPLTAEYTWYLKRDRFVAFLELAKHDCAACLRAGIPFVPICHVSPVQEGEADCGFALHRELLAFARQTARQEGGRLVCATLAEAAQRWEQ